MSVLKRFSTLCACCLLFLTAARSAPADFLDLVAGVRSDLTICQDTSQNFIDEPLTVCNFVAMFDDPEDELLTVGNADITTTDSDGFFQHAFGSTATSPQCFLIPIFPTLVCDSFVTIGWECEEACDSDYCGGGTSTCPGFDSDEFNNNGHIVGGWFNSRPSDGAGDAGNSPDNLVIFLQTVTARGESVSGQIDVFWRDGDSGEVLGAFDLMLECPGPCPGDLNFDGRVGSFDLALLLNSWGPNPGDPADLDGDGIVGAPDLAILLGAWGLCSE